MQNEESAIAKSAQALKRVRKKEREATAKKQAWKSAGSQPAQKALTAPPPAGLAIEDRRDRGGKGGKDRKGGRGSGKSPLPKGIRPKTEDGKLCCYAYSKGEMRGESVQVCTRLLVVPRQPSRRREGRPNC